MSSPLKTSAPQSSGPASPATLKDGGAFAWLQCAGCFCLFFNSWGLVNAFGAYQVYYEKSLLQTSSPSDIAWIGSLQAFLFIVGGIIAGPLYDHGYLQSLVRGGSLLIILGMMLTSLCDKLWQLMLTQGLVIGIGNAALFIPATALLPTYFIKRRALNTGVAISGGNLGGVVYSVTFYQLQPLIGFAWATRVIAFIMLVMLALPVTGLKLRFKPSTARRFFDYQAWAELPFLTFAVSCFIGSIGLYIPYFFVESFALENKLTDQNLAFYLLAVMNAGSILGRIILGYAADHTGPINLLVFCALGCATFAFAWSGVSSLGTILMFCLFYGFFSGTFISLVLTTVATSLCPDIGLIGLRIGMVCLPCAFGLLLGSPVGGIILRNGWLGLQSLAGGTLAVSTIGILALRFLKVGWQVRKKC